MYEKNIIAEALSNYFSYACIHKDNMSICSNI